MRWSTSSLVFWSAATCRTAAVHVAVDDEANVATDEFSQYVVAFGRTYKPGSEEYDMRKGIFEDRLLEIHEQNSLPDRLWKAEVNKLTDRTDAELAMLRGWRHVDWGRPSSLMEEAESSMPDEVAFADLKKKVDWRSLGMTHPVPDQGGCGSCWAVATISMLGGRREIATGDKKELSMQQLVNCVPNPRECGGQGGCNGATVELGMQYIEKMGLADSATVPYTGANGTCDNSLSKDQEAEFLQVGDFHSKQKVTLKGGRGLGLKNWHTLPENKALPLLQALQDGPVAVSVAAKNWASYQNGVFDGCQKDAVIDHAVTAFGYGTQKRKGKNKDVNFWIVRNSWGDNWGEKGFIRVLRSASPEEDDKWCGTDNDPGLGIACKPYPKEVTICGMCGILYDSVVANFNAPDGKKVEAKDATKDMKDAKNYNLKSWTA